MRTLRKWTQDHLAIRSGLSSDSIRRMEASRMAPTLTTMNKLANGFGVDVSTLLEGLNERSPSRCLSQLTDFMSMRTEAEVNALLRIATALFDRETMAPPVVSMVS